MMARRYRCAACKRIAPNEMKNAGRPRFLSPFLQTVKTTLKNLGKFIHVGATAFFVFAFVGSFPLLVQNANYLGKHIPSPPLHFSSLVVIIPVILLLLFEFFDSAQTEKHHLFDELKSWYIKFSDFLRLVLELVVGFYVGLALFSPPVMPGNQTLGQVMLFLLGMTSYYFLMKLRSHSFYILLVFMLLLYLDAIRVPSTHLIFSIAFFLLVLHSGFLLVYSRKDSEAQKYQIR